VDPFHEQIARIALGVAGRYGFCLAGGYAVQAHGFVERESDDVEALTVRLLGWADEIESAGP
jgi:hypothetical protein